MKEQTKKIEAWRQSDEFVYKTDGNNHQVEAKGNVAKGLAVVASVILGFIFGVLLG